MNFALPVLTIAVAVMFLSLVGCVPNKPFRTNIDSPSTEDAHLSTAVIEYGANYKMGVVEIDDQGQFWNVRQLAKVENQIREEAGLATQATSATQPNATARGIILVAFVHGWKDNAAYDGDGIQSFRNILTDLSEQEVAQAGTTRSARPVFGVYVGWRGLSASWEPFKEMTFYERKNTAHKVGGYGALTQLLTELEVIQKDSLSALEQSQPRTELVIIGHSFGGAAVYSALSEILTERFAISLARKAELKPLGDQIILINPAFEAMRHYNLNEMARGVRDYPHPEQRPVLSIFTSEGDWATHYAFPFGRFFSTLFESNRENSDQKAANLDAVGWYKPFVTHELNYHENNLPPATEPAITEKTPSGDNRQRSVENVRRQRDKWKPGNSEAQTYNFQNSTLKPIDGFKPGDPFLVVKVDKRIMKDHTDISNETFVHFISEYIQFCQTETANHQK